MCANRTGTLLSASRTVNILSDRPTARQEENGVVTDTTTTPPVEGAAERLEARAGAIQILRGGDGPPLLFLHAAGGAGTWLPFHGLLARSFEVIAPDHPGFGGSDDLPEVEAIDDLVYHYLDVLDRLGLERVNLVGGSIGGWIAAELAVHSPQRIERLALLGATGLRVPGNMATDIFLMTPDQVVTTLYKHPEPVLQAMPAEPDVDFILSVQRDMAAVARYGWAPYLNDPKLERRLHRIAAPTLVLWADDDRVVPIEHGRRYAERIPDATLRVIEDCGHAMYFERPDAFADAVTEFLEAGS
jgi:pimeloyl-ACP methyl ester carboxylesterase